ncbi:MFS transporter [Malaciobacter molluscorum LMG 25693]|uniref:MFS transporter n=1 Tax=Malaciobacter molluscorum LMG 25693 TaxID=870501 RepID=A0A2G1DEU9_9BACT|nr:MFS transporter [Malaciobacter molluscorum]AXX93524.1 major facilitator superfamily transporter [Malaciobacter molluscorum LMG 25693]PHO16984.1 MFS transporter [Malaciobacter molluscorum LMG 25693]
MNRKQLIIIIYIILVVFSIMYATQPLQPLLAKEFEINIIQASQFTAVIMFSLAIAPIIYGYVLETICPKKMLIYSSVILLVTNLVLSSSNSYEMFLIIRIIESVIIPAIITSCMSILANSDKQNVKYNMAIYVAATVFGGMVGRVISGIIATHFGWRSVFLSLSVALFVALFFIQKLKFEGDTQLTKAKIKDVIEILTDRRFILIYLLMFTTFFVFAGLLNILPFRMKELIPDATETQIGLLYLGYGMGIVVSLLSKKIIKILKGEQNTILVGGLIFCIVNFAFFSDNMLFVFFMIFFFCVGMFMVHSVSTGIANSIKKSQKSLTSGMYLTFYYIGGAVGSIIPAMIYHTFGWNVVLSIFIIILIIIYSIFFRFRKDFDN